MSIFYKKLGYIIWLVMLVMAIVFYKERAFFMDAGFQLFNMINEECIQIYHLPFCYRRPTNFALFIIENKCTTCGCLAGAFSVSYILFFLLVYHLLVHYLKNIELGWVLNIFVHADFARYILPYAERILS